MHHEPEGLRKVTRALRSVGRTVALVPTMGALHSGHLELVQQAKLTGAVVVVSIFVNPLQFGPGEDLDAYPRTLDADLELLREAGVELVFAPSAAAMYPNGPRTTVHPGPLGAELEGAVRPGHFAGMLTVVAKLLQIVAPNSAYFGEKDYQQLALIRQMVTDLNFDVRILGVPTVREADGLALSSRNALLSPEQRQQALALHRALQLARNAADAGEHQSAAIRARALAELTEAGVEPEYFELVDPDTFTAVERIDGTALAVVAARVGGVRLIDNDTIQNGRP